MRTPRCKHPSCGSPLHFRVATFPERFGFGLYLSFAAVTGVLGGPMCDVPATYTFGR